MDTDPLLFPQVGLITEKLFEFGVTGGALTVISSVAGEDTQPETVLVTLTVYIPGTTAIIDAVLVEPAFKPPSTFEMLQAYVAPTSLVTLKFTGVPKQEGFGTAVRFVGIPCAGGSDKVICAFNINELQPKVFVTLKPA